MSRASRYFSRKRDVTYCIERRQLARRELTLHRLRRFAREHHRSCRCPHAETAPSANFYSCMLHLLPLLQRAGVAPSSTRPTPFHEVLRPYETFMREVKGLSEDTRAMRIRSVSPVLRALMPGGRFEPARLSAAALQAYVSARADTYSPKTVCGIVASVRDFLRFLQTRGIETSRALRLLQGPRTTRHLSSRKALTVPQIRALLAPLHKRDPIAMRDLAVVLLLGHAGLRATDVARLQLQDIDARARTLTIRRSKSRRAFELSLTDDAREALLQYVRHARPRVATSAVFITHGFPYDAGISAHTVSSLVRRAFKRAGIEHVSKGAHVLRHTLATQLVAARQPLKAVADVMRHREIDTTARYVRVDLDRLRAAARPWPVEGDDGEVRAT